MFRRRRGNTLDLVRNLEWGRGLIVRIGNGYNNSHHCLIEQQWLFVDKSTLWEMEQTLTSKFTKCSNHENNLKPPRGWEWVKKSAVRKIGYDPTMR